MSYLLDTSILGRLAHDGNGAAHAAHLDAQDDEAVFRIVKGDALDGAGQLFAHDTPLHKAKLMSGRR